MQVMVYVVVFFILLTIAFEGKRVLQGRDWAGLGVASLLLCIALAYAIDADFRLHVLPKFINFLNWLYPYAQMFARWFNLQI